MFCGFSGKVKPPPATLSMVAGGGGLVYLTLMFLCLVTDLELMIFVMHLKLVILAVQNFVLSSIAFLKQLKYDLDLSCLTEICCPSC